MHAFSLLFLGLFLMEEIGRLMNSSLRITKEEKDVLCLDKTLVEEGESTSRIRLLGKLLTKCSFNT